MEMAWSVGPAEQILADPSIGTLQGSFVYGASDRAVVQTNLGWLRVNGDGNTDAAMGHHILALRVGGGFSPRTNRQWIRFTGGVGGGISAAGGFLSPDAGLNLAWDNRYVVPFLNYSAWVSFPERNAQVGVEYVEEASSFLSNDVAAELIRETYRVRRTWGHTVSAGIAIRLAGRRRTILWNAGQMPRGAAISLGMQLHHLRDGFESATFTGILLGVMHRF
jgi:hypothetical protein